MASGFPYDSNGTLIIDAFSNPTASNNLSSPNHAVLHSDVNDAIARIETTLAGRAGGRNLLYNGAMQIHQRVAAATNVAVSANGYYTADRWQTIRQGSSVWNQSVENDAPTGSGFRKSVKMNCTTAEATLGASSEVQFRQLLEGQDVQSALKGTTSALPLYISFWVKSNRTGTYVVEMFDTTNTQHLCRPYTITTADTWEYKTLQIAAGTTGQIANTNSLGLHAAFWLAAGSNFTSGTLPQFNWVSVTTANRAAGQTNLASAVNNYWQVTGVQLTVGAYLQPFEFKSFERELRECQRYYQRLSFPSTNWVAIGMVYPTNSVYATIPLPVTLRTAPTSIVVSGTTYALDAGGVGRGITFAMGSSTTQILGINATSGFNMVNGNAALLGFSTGPNFIELIGTEL